MSNPVHLATLAATVREWTVSMVDIVGQHVACYMGARINAGPIRVYFNGRTWFGGWQTGLDFWCDIGSPSPAYAAAIADAAEQRLVVIPWGRLPDGAL